MEGWMKDLRAAYGLKPVQADTSVRVVRPVGRSFGKTDQTEAVVKARLPRKTGVETFVFRQPRAEPPMTEEGKAQLAADVAAFVKGIK